MDGAPVEYQDPPDLSVGVSADSLPDGGMLAGQVGGEPVLLARRGEEVFALSSSCTHYGAPLTDGLLVGDTLRCPWHHACFSLRTGEAVRGPALDPVTCWHAEESDGMIYVRHRLARTAERPPRSGALLPKSIVIVGGGAAGQAAAEMLRREGYDGRLTMLSADSSFPCDRPNLSKGYLAGTAPDGSNLLRTEEYFRSHAIDLRLGVHVTRIDSVAREVELADGTRLAYEALLLATGAQPIRLELPGAEQAHVHYLRTLADAHALVGAILVSHRAVVIGASFIGLEVTAALRSRGIEVHVVAPDDVPMGKILGSELGGYLRELHESHGVVFHLKTAAASIDSQRDAGEWRNSAGGYCRGRHWRAPVARSCRRGRACHGSRGESG